jgi:hexosaminidase
MAFPRACALSEVLWSLAGEHDFSRFRARLKAQLERLDASGVNYRPLDPAPD